MARNNLLSDLHDTTASAMLKEVTYIWLDGGLVPWHDANVHVMSHSLHYGTAVFEGIRAYKGRVDLYVFRLHDHVRRMYRSAKIYGFPLRYPEDDVKRAVVDLLKANEIEEDAYIRPISFLGYGGIGLVYTGIEPHLAVIAFHYGRYFGKEGVSVTISSWRRICDESAPPAAKASGHYINSVAAKMDALRAGYDEAIMLDHRGMVSEGSGENLFIVRDGVIATPPLSSCILEGVTRDTVMTLAREEGFLMEVRDIARAELYTADEAFFAGTAAEITPILSIDGRVVGDGKPGPTTKRVKEVYERVVRGEDGRHPEWRTPVYGEGGG